MYRFLATRRWLVRTLAGLLLVAVCVRLGMWQLDRNDERSERNDLIESSAQTEPVPIDELADPQAPFDSGDEWRQAELRGEYDADNQLLLRLRPVDGQRGVHAITPLVTESGAAILVDRGFFPSNENIPEVPPPPAGPVDVVGRLRVSEDSHGARLDADAGLIRAVNVGEIADALPYLLYPAWVEATDPIGDGLTAIPPPELESGPHLSYAIQWFIFALVGVTGFVLLVRAEARGRRQLGDPEPDDATSGELSTLESTTKGG